MSEFSNDNIESIEQLSQFNLESKADIQKQSFHKVHADYKRVVMIPYGVFATGLLMLHILLVWLVDGILWWYGLLPWALFLISVFYKRAYVNTLQYAIREQDITLKSGVIFKKMVIQPFTRLQHIEIKRGPLERHKGLASLALFSAGGSLHALEIKGLLESEAQTLKQFILEHKDLKNG